MDVSVQEGTTWHLDVSVQEGTKWHLDVSVQEGTKWHMAISVTWCLLALKQRVTYVVTWTMPLWFEESSPPTTPEAPVISFVFEVKCVHEWGYLCWEPVKQECIMHDLGFTTSKTRHTENLPCANVSVKIFRKDSMWQDVEWQDYPRPHSDDGATQSNWGSHTELCTCLKSKLIKSCGMDL